MDDETLGALIISWYETNEKAKEFLQKETVLRKIVFEEAFPNPRNGINELKLSGGYVLKANYKGRCLINMKIVEEVNDTTITG